MTARLIPLDRFALEQVLADERDPLTAEMSSGDEFAQRALGSRGLAYGLLDGGMFVAAGGLVPMWHGRAEAWQLTSRHARPRHLVQAVDAAARTMDARQRDPAFRRIEMYVRADHPWARSFIAALGFGIEGVLAKWDPLGRDMLVCARVREAG